MLIEADKRKAMMNYVRGQKRFKIVVTAPPTYIANVMGKENVPTEANVISVEDLPPFLFFDFRFKFKRNKLEDKAETYYRTITSEESLIRPFIHEAEIDSSDTTLHLMTTPELTRMKMRASILSGFALCALTVSSKVCGYLDSQSAKNRYFKVHHKALFNIIEPHVTFTGDFKTDFHNVFIALWFHYPEDLTGHDAQIKMDSLRMVDTFNH